MKLTAKSLKKTAPGTDEAAALSCLAEYLIPGGGRLGLKRLVDRWREQPRQLGIQLVQLLENPLVDPLLLQLPVEGVQEFVRTVQNDHSGQLAAAVADRENPRTRTWLNNFAGDGIKRYLNHIHRQSAEVAVELHCSGGEAARFLLGGPASFCFNGEQRPGGWMDIGEFLEDREQELRNRPGGSWTAFAVAQRIGLNTSRPVTGKREWRRICRRLYELDGYPGQAVPLGNGLPAGFLPRWGAPLSVFTATFFLFLGGLDSPGAGLFSGLIAGAFVKVLFGNIRQS